MPDADTTASAAITRAALDHLSVAVVVSVGGARIPVTEVMSLSLNGIIALDRRVEDPVDLIVGETVVARGLLEEAEGSPDGSLLVRVTEVLSPTGSG